MIDQKNTNSGSNIEQAESQKTNSSHPHKWLVGVLIALSVIAVAVAAAYYFSDRMNNPQRNDNEAVICMTDAKICPDGTAVGRKGPNCEFAMCPGSNPALSEVEGWQTYRNEEYGFELKYPNNLDLQNEYKNPSSGNLQVYIGSNEEVAYFEVQVKKDLNLDEYFYLDFNPNSENILGGRKAQVYEAPNGYCDGPGCGPAFIAFVTKKGTEFYHLIFYGDAELSLLENQILSKFRFLS